MAATLAILEANIFQEIATTKQHQIQARSSIAIDTIARDAITNNSRTPGYPVLWPFAAAPSAPARWSC